MSVVVPDEATEKLKKSTSESSSMLVKSVAAAAMIVELPALIPLLTLPPELITPRLVAVPKVLLPPLFSKASP